MNGELPKRMCESHGYTVAKNVKYQQYKVIFFYRFMGKTLYNDFMNLDELKEMVTQKLAYAPPLGACMKFDFGDDGVFYLDGRQSPPILTKDDMDDVDTTLTCSLDLLQKVLNGTQDPTMAYMTGKLKVSGSMGYALKLVSLLED